MLYSNITVPAGKHIPHHTGWLEKWRSRHIWQCRVYIGVHRTDLYPVRSTYVGFSCDISSCIRTRDILLC